MMHVSKKNLHMNYTWLRGWVTEKIFREKIHTASDSYSTLTAMKQDETAYSLHPRHRGSLCTH